MVEPEEDPHVMAAFVRISIAPVGVADIRHAIGAAAIGGVRDPDPFCVIGSGEGKGAAPRRHECLNLPRGITCAGGNPLSFDPTTVAVVDRSNTEMSTAARHMRAFHLTCIFVVSPICWGTCHWEPMGGTST